MQDEDDIKRRKVLQAYTGGRKRMLEQTLVFEG
jgi:hypothetical protein